jgi:hypothetical protein
MGAEANGTKRFEPVIPTIEGRGNIRENDDRAGAIDPIELSRIGFVGRFVNFD